MLKVLFFDAFRTLFDTKDTHIEAVRLIFETQNVTGVDIEAFHNKWDEYILENWTAPGGFRLQWPMFEECLARAFEHFGISHGDAAAGNKLWLELVAGAPPFPEARRVVGPLQKQYRTAIVSNSDNFEMKICLERLALDFDAVFTSEDARCYKPRPEIFKMALEYFQAAPQEAIMIGDSWTADVQGAAAAGLRCVWINRTGRDTPSGGAQPVAVLPDLNDLPHVLETLK